MRVFGDGAFRKCLDPEGGVFMNGISALIIRGPDDLLAHFPQREDAKDTARSRQSVTWKRPSQNPPTLAP